MHPREVFKAAIRKGANGIVLAHNHPSGDPAPSKEGISLTHRLREAGLMLGDQMQNLVAKRKGNCLLYKDFGTVVPNGLL